MIFNTERFTRFRNWIFFYFENTFFLRRTPKKRHLLTILLAWKNFQLPEKCTNTLIQAHFGQWVFIRLYRQHKYRHIGISAVPHSRKLPSQKIQWIRTFFILTRRALNLFICNVTYLNVFQCETWFSIWKKNTLINEMINDHRFVDGNLFFFNFCKQIETKTGDLKFSSFSIALPFPGYESWPVRNTNKMRQRDEFSK